MGIAAEVMSLVTGLTGARRHSTPERTPASRVIWLTEDIQTRGFRKDLLTKEKDTLLDRFYSAAKEAAPKLLDQFVEQGHELTSITESQINSLMKQMNDEVDSRLQLFDGRKIMASRKQGIDGFDRETMGREVRAILESAIQAKLRPG